MPRLRKGAHTWPSAIVAVPLVLVLVVTMAAASEIPIDSDPPGQRFWLLPTSQQLALQDTVTTPAAEQAPLPSESERRPNWLLASLLSSASVLGGAANSLTDHCCQSYHFANEGWFGANTHYGGADKASHLTSYYIVSKEFAKMYVVLGLKPENARWLAAGVAAVTGLANEIADGLNRDGFSYQDLVMDIGGSLAAALVDAAKAEDLVGFRRGFVNINDCCNYSNEIYTADLALVGVARRLRLNIGPLKYLLLSATYRTQGYPSDPNRQRQVGVEIGLNFKQILDDLNVRRDKWWGYGLHVVFDNFRFPYTAGGYFYDLNHGRWHGPNAGF